MTENLGSELNVSAPTLKTVTSATRIQVTMYEFARSFALIMVVVIMVVVIMVMVNMVALIVVVVMALVVMMALVRFAYMTMYDVFGASAIIFSCN